MNPACRHGSCIIILKNDEGILLCCDSVEVAGGMIFRGVDKFRKYGNCYAVCCGTLSHYEAVDQHLITATDDLRTPPTAQALATLTYDFCQPTAARGALDCHFFFASLDPNPQWVSYGPVKSQQPRHLPFAFGGQVLMLLSQSTPTPGGAKGLRPI
ncbi:hypothetical protein C5167_002723 [Papaver somniferum]|uniref:Uncharacterized protein n=1 Tax=Papaver somniferum TaxID=3469 RepID=A0A4Y7KZZ3_PAPSO|nr:uncharacterized protein LOC113312596 [Papaver somniferum]RZC78476.1 hypothetical protein C5167_002723 [Papaver somniferum]